MSAATRRVDANFMGLVLSNEAAKSLRRREGPCRMRLLTPSCQQESACDAPRRPIVPDHPNPAPIHATGDRRCAGAGTRRRLQSKEQAKKEVTNMAEIFVSYKSSDRPRAETLKSWFEGAGWSVWI